MGARPAARRLQVLEACGKEDLAAEAAGALQEMSAGIIP